MVLSKPINKTNIFFFFLLLGIKENIVPITKRRTKSELLILMLLDLHVSFSFFVNDLLAHISLSQFISKQCEV
jgi:hypothetical protein